MYIGILIAEQHGLHVLVVGHVLEGQKIAWFEAAQINADSAGFGDESR